MDLDEPFSENISSRTKFWK